MMRGSVRSFVYVASLFLCMLLGIAIGLRFSLDSHRGELSSAPHTRSRIKPQPEPCPGVGGEEPPRLARTPEVEPRNIGELLARCDKRNSPESFERVLDEAIARNKCLKPLAASEFVCAAQCPEVDDELERTVRILRTGNHSAEWLIQSCKAKLFPMLIWVNSKGRIKFMYCVKESGVIGPELWRESQRMLVLVGCVAQLSNKDFLFGFDASDYSTPTYGAPYDLFHYIEFLPAVLRYVGNRAHNPHLFPTSSHLVATGLCRFRENRMWWQFCYEEKSQHTIPFQEREKVLLWRGLPTGTGWSEHHWTFMQRLALIRDFVDKPGFDVGFVRDVKKFANTSALLSKLVDQVWVKKPHILKHEHPKYAFLLHVDGNTASWGISHKLASGSTLVWVESQHDYKEHFYHHLKPWEHFVPVAVDMGDLEAVRDWLFQNPDKAERIAGNARKLVETKLHPTKTICYVYRLLASIAAAQQPSMDPDKTEINEKFIRETMGEGMFALFREPSVYSAINKGYAPIYSAENGRRHPSYAVEEGSQGEG
jgi:hypothetical protein